jgi:hypothetical protein
VCQVCVLYMKRHTIRESREKEDPLPAEVPERIRKAAAVSLRRPALLQATAVNESASGVAVQPGIAIVCPLQLQYADVAALAFR